MKEDKICCLFPILGIIIVIVILVIYINLNPPFSSYSSESDIELIRARQNLNYTEVINMDLDKIELDLKERGYNVILNSEPYPRYNWTKGFTASMYSNNSTSYGLYVMIYASQNPMQIAELDISYWHPGEDDYLEYYKNEIKTKVTEVCNIAKVTVNVDQIEFVVTYDCS